MQSATEQHANYIAIWSKAVDTQNFSDEMSVKSRQLGLTFVSATLGVAVVLLGQGDNFSLIFDICGHSFRLHISVLLVLAALGALRAVRGLDIHVYHRMLRGAVSFNEDFEQNYMKQIFNLEKGMTQAISHYSRHDDAGREAKDGKAHYTGTSSMTAEEKVRKFYFQTSLFLVIAAVLLLIVTNVASV